MSVYTLDTELVIQDGDAQWRVHRVEDNQYVQLEHQTTARIRRVRIAKLAGDIASGKLSVVRDSEASQSGQTALASHAVMCTATLPEKYKSQFERTYAYVWHMRKRGITKGQRRRVTDAIPTIASTLGDHSPPEPPTVMQWMRDYEASGQNPTSLVSRNIRRRTSRKLTPAILEIVQKVLARYYFVRKGCTLRAVHDKVLQEVERAAQATPIEETAVSISLSTIRRLAAETTPFDRDRARLGPAQARAKWRFSKPGTYATRPLERVEMDHTLLDLVVIDDALGIPLGRPTITLLVCSFSSYILGFFISFEGETIGRVVQSIKVAAQPKDSITAGQGLSNTWHAMGLWETLVLDNSLSFHSPHLRHIASELCMDIEYCPVRMPWFKPSVERMLGELTRQLPAHGRPKKPDSGPDPIDPNSTACITFSDLCAGVLQWVVDVHPFEINERKMARPIDLFLEGLTSCPAPALIDNSANLEVIAGLSTIKTVDHSGIVNTYLRYTSDELKSMQRCIGTKFKTLIKFNPYDLGSIFVQHPRTGLWISVGARDEEYATGLTLTQHKLIRKEAGRKLTLANAETHLRAARLALQDRWEQAIRGGRKVKRSRELGLFQGVSSLSWSNPLQRPGSTKPTSVVVDNDMPEPDSRSIPTFEVFAGDAP
ncbi:transposase [Ralstonia nicotianae]